jgi:CarD family transcriptional regulator
MNEMAQKKKVEVRAKPAFKPVQRKVASTAKVAAPTKPLKQKAETVKAAAPVKAKAAAEAKFAPKKPVAAPIKVPASKREAKPVHAHAAPAAKRPVQAPVAAAPKPATAMPPVAKPAHVPAHAAAGRALPASVQKPVGQKLTAPVAAQPAMAAAQTPKAIAEKAAAQRQLLQVQKKPVSQRHGFKANEFIVYPTHGVGRIIGIEDQEIAGMSLELFVIAFEKEKLTLRVPTGKLASVGMRKLADDGIVKKAMETLKGRARIKRTMWSRRAQEYVAKINSGDLVSIAEVVRDLYRSEAQPEQSYSERQLYEDALDRMAREIAAVEKLDERGAVQRITEVLSKSAKSRRAAGEGDSSVGEAA